MTADTASSLPTIQILFLILIPALFVTSFFVVELVPGWRRNPVLKSRQLFAVGAVLTILGIGWFLAGVHEFVALGGGENHPWLFTLYLILFLAFAELLKLAYERTRT